MRREGKNMQLNRFRNSWLNALKEQGVDTVFGYPGGTILKYL